MYTIRNNTSLCSSFAPFGPIYSANEIALPSRSGRSGMYSKMSTKQGIARSVQVKTCFTSEKPLHVKPRGIKKKRKSKRASKGKNWRRVSKSKHAKHHDQKHTFSHHSIKQSSLSFTSLPARTSSIISTATMDQDQAQLVNPAQSFWLNYKHATAWQNKHFMNYWKSRCAALELENQHLYRTIQNLTQSHTYSLNLETEGDPTQLPDLDIDKNIQREEEKMEEPNESKQVHEETCQGNSEECTEGNEDDNFSFDVNDELIEFLAISAKHKMDLKKKKESELEKEAAELAQKAPIKEKLPREIMEERKVEMEKLYGADSAPMILGMETAMQLSFDKFIDKHQPKHWPNIPLNP